MITDYCDEKYASNKTTFENDLSKVNFNSPVNRDDVNKLALMAASTSALPLR